MKDLTAKYLKELFIYDSETGNLVWKERLAHHFKNNKAYKSWNARFPGTVAGYLNLGYPTVCIDGYSYRAHRLIWLMHYGSWPKYQIDHINGIKSDNRLSNLRDVSQSENTLNQKLHSRNKSGVSGIHWHSRDQKWISRIRINHKETHLYGGLDFFEACCRRKSAEVKHGFHENHGRVAQ